MSFLVLEVNEDVIRPIFGYIRSKEFEEYEAARRYALKLQELEGIHVEIVTSDDENMFHREFKEENDA